VDQGVSGSLGLPTTEKVAPLLNNSQHDGDDDEDDDERTLPVLRAKAPAGSERT